MDISKTSDLKELKAMAYDMLVAKESAEGNLRLINQRIAQLQQKSQEKDTEAQPE